MGNSNFGLSNPCLKVGAALVTVSLAVIGFTSFFSVDRAFQAAVRSIGGFALLSGTVVYIIGRLVRAKHARA